MTFKASNVVPRLPADPVIDSSPELFVTLTSGGCQFFFFFLHSVMFGFLFLWGRNEQHDFNSLQVAVSDAVNLEPPPPPAAVAFYKHAIR